MPEVKLKGQVTDLAAVPESHRSLYSKVGEVFVLGEVTLEDTEGLRNTVTATRKERDTAIAAAKKVEGFDVEGYNKWLADNDTAAADAAKKKGDWDSREAQIKKNNDAALKAKDEQLAKTNQALHSEMVTARAFAALKEADANALGLDWLLPKLETALRIVDESGMLNLRVVDASGTVRPNSKGEPMTVTELVAEFKAQEKFAGAFAASGSGGTGSSAGRNDGKSGSGGKTIKRADFDKLDRYEQADFVQTQKYVVVD